MEHVLKLVDYMNPDATVEGASVFGLVRTGVDKVNLKKLGRLFWKRKQAAQSVINVALYLVRCEKNTVG